MPANPGRNPFEGNDNPPMVDIRYRCGLVARAVDPNKRRWKPWPGKIDSMDIVSWQMAEGKEYELVWPVDKKVGNPNIYAEFRDKSVA